MARIDSGGCSVSADWLHYADPPLAPLRRSRTGSITPIIGWLQYADHEVAPLRRSVTRVPRLAEELRILHGAGSFRRWLQQLAKIDVLVLDDWGIGNLDAATRADLLEVIDDRVGQRATIIAHQLPIEHWHAWLGDPTVADAILDRLLQSCRRFSLDGESRRTGRTARTATVSKTTIKEPNEYLTAPPKP